VPWCEECAKYLTPNTVRNDGSCPTCGHPVGDVERRAAAETADDSAPWHFKLLIVAVVGYLAWRLIELLGWLV
jgi:hypothetical protein